MKFLHSLLFLFIVYFSSYAQVTFPYNGIETKLSNHIAFIHANVQLDAENYINDATLIIKDGKIEDVGKNINIPKDAVIKNLNYAMVFPAFIEMYSDYGIQKTEKENNFKRGPQLESNTEGAFNWNQAIHPETDAAKLFSVNDDEASKYRKMGFAITLSHLEDGISRGTGIITMTGDETNPIMLMNSNASSNFSFYKGSSTQDYPSSLMGSIALLRQTFYDANWYALSGFKQEQNLSLEALNKQLSLPKIFESRDAESILRANTLGKEFGYSFIIKGNGDEYQLASEIKKTNSTLIIPINYPKPYDINSSVNASFIPLTVLKHWELAPYNLSILFQNKIPFCITSSESEDINSFIKNLQLTVQSGLPAAEALRALTETPAKLLNIYNTTGSIQKGKIANFIISEGDIFYKGSKIIDLYVNGKKYEINSPQPEIISGDYNLVIDKMGPFKTNIEVKGSDIKAKIIWKNSKEIDATFTYNNQLVEIKFKPDSASEKYYTLLGYQVDTVFTGDGINPDGNKLFWTATLTKRPIEADTTMLEAKINYPKTLYPFQSYGWDTVPTAHDVIIKNTTVWTNESVGNLNNTDVLIKNGKIFEIGKNISSSTAQIIDGTGKYLTSGIIDEHSHIAISQGVNEGTQSVTSEVRIGDVINCNDVNIYRQLAGGVTCSHLLHGSANCIGGQTQLIKLRWGYAPEQLKFVGWPGFIKFALGENVKQSNWGDLNTIRFPQTRMGVEGVFIYSFSKAKEYEMEWKKYNSLSTKIKLNTPLPRKDLELDALVEIINGKRFITCHSYQQGEINMLMHVADSFGFKVNTFTHILEGYKVADKMKSHGVNASSFSDWWAYKYEVTDAIPYNGALLHNMGVNTSFNSDDAEMARRLNQEAAKAMKYGGLSEIEAWKFVTLNPAIMLHIDDKVGSIKVGKDADIVLWSDNPLSMYAKAEYTFVDGICFFDLKTDLQKREYILKEKDRIIQLMIQAKEKGEATQPLQIQFNELYDCDTSGDFVN